MSAIVLFLCNRTGYKDSNQLRPKTHLSAFDGDQTNTAELRWNEGAKSYKEKSIMLRILWRCWLCLLWLWLLGFNLEAPSSSTSSTCGLVRMMVLPIKTNNENVSPIISLFPFFASSQRSGAPRRRPPPPSQFQTAMQTIERRDPKWVRVPKRSLLQEELQMNSPPEDVPINKS